MPLIEGWIELVKGPTSKNFGTSDEVYKVAWDLRWEADNGWCAGAGEDWINFNEGYGNYYSPTTGDLP